MQPSFILLTFIFILSVVRVIVVSVRPPESFAVINGDKTDTTSKDKTNIVQQPHVGKEEKTSVSKKHNTHDISYRTDPCYSFYDHVCLGDISEEWEHNEKDRTFRPIIKKNAHVLYHAIQEMQFYNICMKDLSYYKGAEAPIIQSIQNQYEEKKLSHDNLNKIKFNDGKKHFMDNMEWNNINHSGFYRIVDLLKRGRAFPVSVTVSKALHTPVYIVEFNVNFFLYELMAKAPYQNYESKLLLQLYEAAPELWDGFEPDDTYNNLTTTEETIFKDDFTVDDYIAGYVYWHNAKLDPHWLHILEVVFNSDKNSTNNQKLSPFDFSNTLFHFNGYSEVYNYFLHKWLHAYTDTELESLSNYLDHYLTYLLSLDIVIDTILPNYSNSHPKFKLSTGQEEKRQKEEGKSSKFTMNWYLSMSYHHSQWSSYRTINNQDFLEYLSLPLSLFSKPQLVFNDHRLSDSLKIAQRECLSLTKQVMLHELNRIYFNKIIRIQDEYVLGFDRTKYIHQLGLTIRDKIVSIIKNSSWISQTTKDALTKKLECVEFYVLHNPLKIVDYDMAMKKPEHTWFQKVDTWLHYTAQSNRRQLLETYEYQRKHLHRFLFDTTPYDIVNAWYNPTQNSITIPPGILHHPIFKGNWLYDLSNIGMVIAHELGHAVDNEGRLFDFQGNWMGEDNNCWDKHDQASFDKKIACLAKDYGHPCGYDNYGMNTMGEDMADQMGVRASLAVFEEYVGNPALWVRVTAQSAEGGFPSSSPPSEKPINSSQYQNLTQLELQHEKELFFKHYARLWCARQTKENQCRQVYNDVHALARHRVDKTLRQLPQFSDTFLCNNTSKIRTNALHKMFLPHTKYNNIPLLNSHGLVNNNNNNGGGDDNKVNEKEEKFASNKKKKTSPTMANQPGCLIY